MTTDRQTNKRLILFICVLVIISIVGCNIGTKSNGEISYGITRNQYNWSYKFPTDDMVLEMANDIIDGHLWVLDTMESLDYDAIEMLDWDIQYTDSPNSFQLYLQCLNPVMYLTKAYEISNQVAYLEFAEKFIDKWNVYRHSAKASDNPFVWYDHGTALRAETLIYYALVKETIDDNTKMKLYDLILEHAEWLNDDKNYTSNHNHGIFQDRALIYCAKFLRNKDYLEHAKNRLETQKEYAFNDEMIHVENSPGYQVGVMELFRMIAEFLVQYEDDFGQKLYDDVKKSAEFMAYITKPNGYLAEIGDTNSGTDSSVVTNARLSVFDNKHLTYASTQGMDGEMPNESSVIYAEGGYYVSHNSWDNTNYSDSTWQMFKSGYSSRTHKHADDNSFMLYSKGYDIFVDTGWYNYMTGDRYRDYFVSPLAHNTVAVDGQTYSVTAENSGKAGIYDYEKNENYDYVLGYNEMYNGVSFDRHYYNLGDAVIIYDNIISAEEHGYEQLFQASEVMEIVYEANDETLFKLGDTGYYVRVRQLLDVGDFSVVKGDFSDEKYGYISRKGGHLDSINTLKYNINARNTDIITLITIEDSEQNVDKINKIEFNLSTKRFDIEKVDGKNFSINLGARNRLNVKDITVQQENDNTFLFCNKCASDKGKCEYAWYVINKDTAEVIYKCDYDENPCFEYSFEGEGCYFIKAYVRSENGRYRTSGIIAAISSRKDHIYEDVTSGFPYLNLEYNGQSFENISAKKYRFYIDFNYSWNSNINWYVYQNGGYYDSFSKINEKTMEYTFDEKGSYTVMYYLRTPDGDNEFRNFAEIVID